MSKPDDVAKEVIDQAAADKAAADIFQVSTQDLAGYLSFRPKLLLQDPSDIMAVSKRRLNRWVRRMIHTVVNDRFVRPLAVAVRIFRAPSIHCKGISVHHATSL